MAAQRVKVSEKGSLIVKWDDSCSYTAQLSENLTQNLTLAAKTAPLSPYKLPLPRLASK